MTASIYHSTWRCQLKRGSRAWKFGSEKRRQHHQPPNNIIHDAAWWRVKIIGSMFTAFSSFARRATSTFMFSRLFAAEFIALLVVLVLPNLHEVNLHAIKRNQIEFRPPRCHRFDSESLGIFDPIRIISARGRILITVFGARSVKFLFVHSHDDFVFTAPTYHHPECFGGKIRKSREEINLGRARRGGCWAFVTIIGRERRVVACLLTLPSSTDSEWSRKERKGICPSLEIKLNVPIIRLDSIRARGAQSPINLIGDWKWPNECWHIKLVMEHVGFKAEATNSQPSSTFSVLCFADFVISASPNRFPSASGLRSC